MVQGPTDLTRANRPVFTDALSPPPALGLRLGAPRKHPCVRVLVPQQEGSRVLTAPEGFNGESRRHFARRRRSLVNDFVQIAVEAEELGYDTVVGGEVAGAEVMATLGTMAARTDRVRRRPG